MDNLTHTLTGMMIAEGLCAARRSGRSAFRSTAFAASAIANNIPDIDPIYTSITQPRPLGSLLHHRGQLRYDRSPTLDFADMRLDGQTTCPSWLPPWLAPRADLFGPN